MLSVRKRGWFFIGNRVRRPISTTSRSTAQIRIGDVRLSVKEPLNPELVPKGYDHEGGSNTSQEALAHLRWMLQKDSLGQDIFLVGPPGPQRRWLALRYAELVQREVEVVPISRDTTEADLKQRREIVNKTAEFQDQAPVRAALQGRLLILDGIEKAERNVLPTLNNLLENREMQLDDGRFLVSHKRFAELLKAGTSEEELQRNKIVSVHPDFRVVALGIPVPPYTGKPLDPPLRSRFQARAVKPWSAGVQWMEMLSHLPASSSNLDKNLEASLRKVLGVSQALMAAEEMGISKAQTGPRMPHFPHTSLGSYATNLLKKFPNESPLSVLARLFPYVAPGPPFGLPLTKTSLVHRRNAALALDQYSLNQADFYPSRYTFQEAKAKAKKNQKPSEAKFVFSTKSEKCDQVVEESAPVGPFFCETETETETETEQTGARGLVPGQQVYHKTDSVQAVLTGLLQDHCVGRHSLVVGRAGSGKSLLARSFGAEIGYHTIVFNLYKDMTARDLLQRRATDEVGNTTWEHSPLVEAALFGKLCVLDGVDRVHTDTLAVIQRALVDRDLDLFDGTRGVVHKNFRVVALGLPPSDTNPWVNANILAMFSSHFLPELTHTDHEALVFRAFPKAPPEVVHLVVKFAEALQAEPESRKRSQKPEEPEFYMSRGYKRKLRTRSDLVGQFHAKEKEKVLLNMKATTTVAKTLGISPLSTRQLLRIGRRCEAFPLDAAKTLRASLVEALLGTFLPQSQRQALEDLLDEAGVPPYSINDEETPTKLEIKENEKTLCIGDVEVEVCSPARPELVPAPVFFDMPVHVKVLRSILKDLKAGENHLLLIGNQGVGKNKLTDRLLQLLRLEREYVQLHRDSTVGSLTLAPNLKEGMIVWDDSPLVRAVVHGRVLVIDEADKAPLEVVAVLKSLVEDKEMLLADGRRLLSPIRAQQELKIDPKAKVVPIHPNFKLWVLANRPGFPFLGNNFFREIGDIFSTHVVSNPDPESELFLLQKYAPSVDQNLLLSLVNAFKELREMVEKGLLAYPYSVREAVAVAVHLEQFPQDGLVPALENVLAFDAYDFQLRASIAAVFRKHGVPLPDVDLGTQEWGNFKISIQHPDDLPPVVKTEEWKDL